MTAQADCRAAAAHFDALSRGLRRLAALALLLGGVAGAAIAGAPLRADLPTPRPAGVAADRAEEAFPAAAAIIARARLSGDVGFALIDLDSGAAIETRLADRGFPPASVAKTFTAVYALETLGPEYRFETSLIAGAPIADGVLNGALTLRGGGDPDLDTDALAELLAQARQRGLRAVRGGFLVDAGDIPTVARIDPDQPEHVAYNPSVAGLNLNYNRVLFEWEKTRDGARRLSMQARSRNHSPEISGISIGLAPPGAPVFTRRDVPRDKGSEEAWAVAEGALNRKGNRWLPVRRPAIYAGETFRALAAAEGLTLPPPSLATGAGGGQSLARRQSRPLTDTVRAMLKYSTNLTAEALGLAASRARGAKARDLAESGAAMSRWAARRAGLDHGSGLDLHNHSGLSALSRVSPLSMTAFLRAADRASPSIFAANAESPIAAVALTQGAGSASGLQARKSQGGRDASAQAGSVGLAALNGARRPGPAVAARPEIGAGAGRAGMLGELLKSVDLRARKGEAELPGPASASAKTGTLFFVSGLAGYLTAASGRRVAFAIFSEDLDRRRALKDRDAGGGGARGWIRRAKRMERALLRSWAARL